VNWNDFRDALVANQVQIFSVGRYVLTLLCGFAVGHGIASADTVTLLSGIAVAIAPLAMTILAHTQKAQIANVAAMPEVKTIVATKEIAAVQGEKVTNGFVAPKAP
jgi:hypothetical protein